MRYIKQSLGHILPGKRGILQVLGQVFIIFSLVFALVVVLKQSRQLKPNDFIRYWASANLLVQGGNPYDIDRLYEKQREGGYEGEERISLYNPPLIYPILIPFSLVERQLSQLLWLLLHITVIFICCLQIWRTLSGDNHYLWLSWLLAFSFGPAFAAIGYTGQITPLLLLGFTGLFIGINKPNRDWLNGLFFSLILIKPQVSYLFIVLFIIWAFNQRRWILILSTIIVVTSTIIFGMIFDHLLIIHFFQNVINNSPTTWATPMIGTYLRYFTEFKGFWIQFFIPLILGIMMIRYYWKRRENWDWQSVLPWILFLSVITSPYAWTYDFVILIIPLLIGFDHLLKHNSKRPAIMLAGIYIIINGAYWWLHLKYTDFYFIWFAPALFIWYIMVQAASKYIHSSA